MSKKNHAPGPVPPDNQPIAGPGLQPGTDAANPANPGDTTPTTPSLDQEQDPERRFGNYGGKGEPPIQQPGGKSGGGGHNQ